MKPGPNQGQIVTQHRFTKRHIRLWLPVLMVAQLVLCGWLAAPRFRLLGIVSLIFMTYVAVSALVAVAEITVTENGLMINRLLLPRRFVPWENIDRVIVYGAVGDYEGRLEIASIGFRKGLSPLNRLPGLVYGQGLRQTIIATPDALQDYEELLAALEAHCPIIWQSPQR